MRPSWTTSIQRNLSFLAPRTWFGIHHALSKQIPNPAATLGTFSTWLHHILIPFLLLTTVMHHPRSSYHKPIARSAQQAAIITALSPLNANQIVLCITTIASRLSMWKLSRQEADNEALETLSRDVSFGFASRNWRFDMYFPNEMNFSKKEHQNQKAMLFIPGFLVDHASYASIASRIASEGDILVVVLSLEPLRMAEKFFLELVELKKCMKIATKLWKQKRGYKGVGTLDWSLCGHSYGGYAAMRLATPLAEYLEKSCENKLKVLIWAAGDRESFLTDLSTRNDTSIMVLLGDSDTLCKIDENKYRILQSFLPIDTEIRTIFGSHDNFASYSKEYGISRVEQHRQISNSTIYFLNHHKHNLATPLH
jgi:hypothetical protein